MVKTININVTYDNQRHLITCQQHEFAKKVAERFNIDISDVVLFSVKKNERYQITPRDVTDLMKIEMIHKDGQRTLRSYFGNDSSPVKSFENIITKLQHNSPLNGPERKSLIDLLEEHSTLSSKKRKVNEGGNGRNSANKKVQVDIPGNVKDSFAQTDPYNIVRSKKNEEESLSIKIKKLANGHASKEEIEQLMNESFDDRRSFILVKSPPVAQVRDQYPSLFQLDEVKNELERIFFPGRCHLFLNNMERYSKFILRNLDASDDIIVRTQKSIQRAHTPIQKTYASVVGSVFALTKQMEEEFSFIHLQDYPHGDDDVYPHIDASCQLLEIFSDNFVFNVIVEGQQLCEAPNLPEAILCLIATFFIFDINYPNSCHRTLTVFEKLYLNANATTDVDEMTEQIVRLCQQQLKEEQNARCIKEKNVL